MKTRVWKNGELHEIEQPDVVEDIVLPLEPTPEERIAALEEELSATKILLGLEE